MTLGTRNEVKVILVSSVLAMADDRMTLGTGNKDKVILVSSVLAIWQTIGWHKDDEMRTRSFFFSTLCISNCKRSDDAEYTK